MRAQWNVLVLAGLLGAASATAQESAEFVLALSGNGSGRPLVYRGEPLLVQLLLVLERGEAAAVALNGDRPWTDGLRLSLADAEGKEVEVEWRRLGPAAARLEFTAEASEAAALFALPPEAADALAAGEYRIRAEFQTEGAAAPDTWRGRVPSETLPLRVMADPREDTPAGSAFRQRLLARWLLLDGKAAAALEAIEQALSRQPEDVHALKERAEVLVALDRRDEAVAALEQAMAAFRKQNPRATHPPRELLLLLREIQPL